VVYLCTGSLPDAYATIVAELNNASTGLHYTFRGRLTDGVVLPRLPSRTGVQRAVHSSVVRHTQDHFMSFVELLLLARAKAAFVTLFSSLKFAVFAHRCANADGEVYGFDVEGSASSAGLRFGRPRSYPCGDVDRQRQSWCGHPSWA
jgi:hypothetical protein